MILVKLLQLLQNNLLYGLDIVTVQVSLEHFFLQVSQLIVSKFSIEVVVEYSEDPGNGFFKLGSELFVVKVIQWGEWVENCPLRTIEYFLYISIVVSRTLKAHLDLPVLFDEALDDVSDINVIEFLIGHFEFLFVQFIPNQNQRDLNRFPIIPSF